MSLNPKTPISALMDVINDIDLILIMSVNPGFAGQSFMSEVLPKVSELRKMINDKKLKIDIEIQPSTFQLHPDDSIHVLEIRAERP